MIALLALLAALPAAGTPGALRLPVPIVRQRPERCGPAALAMVLGRYGADSIAVGEADRAYDPVLRGALITDLAACARRAGFAARIASPGVDSLATLLQAGVPPILLVAHGIGPIARGHYLVVVGCDAKRGRFVVHDGGATPRDVSARSLARAWSASGGQALIVWREPS